MVQVGLGGRLGVNCICEDCRAQDAEHMSKRPFCIPLAKTPASRLRFRQFVALGEIPQADDALHQPHPRRQLLDALPAPVLRSLDLHHLLARLECDLDRPSPKERRDHPTQVGIRVGGEQIRQSEHCCPTQVVEVAAHGRTIERAVWSEVKLRRVHLSIQPATVHAHRRARNACFLKPAEE